MSIADKILRAKEDYDNVYDAGKGKGYTEGYAHGEQNGYDLGFDEGKKSEYDAFWDKFQLFGERDDYRQGFSGAGWTDKTFKPKYNIVPLIAQGMFAYSGIKNLKQYLIDNNVTLDFGQNTRFTQMFATSALEVAPEIDVRGDVYSSGLNQMFYGCSNLHTIDKIILKDDGSSILGSSTFYKCYALTEIRFEGVIGQNLDLGDCPLSKESIKSVMEALSETRGASLTLNADAVNNAFSSEEWSELKAKRSKWSFNV